MDFVRTPEKRFERLLDYPFEPHYVEVDGLRMHYLDEGPANEKFLLELGAEPTHILCNHANKRWKKAMDEILASSPFGADCEVHIGKDLWHLRSLCFTNKPDFLIGNSYGKEITRDTLHKGKEFEVPLIRLGFPIFDHHHLHRQTTLGYEGAMQMLTTIVNAVLDRLDDETSGMQTTDYNYDLVR